jgi:hypothetical protein
MPISYQNQSTVWYLGGENITFNGFGTGTFNGNGQTWYDFTKGRSNYPSMFYAGWSIAHARFLTLNRTTNGLDNIQSKQLRLQAIALCTKPDVDNDRDVLL